MRRLDKPPHRRAIGDGNPWWSLAVFFLCIYVLQDILI
jgi:hypothetical protein